MVGDHCGRADIRRSGPADVPRGGRSAFTRWRITPERHPLLPQGCQLHGWNHTPAQAARGLRRGRPPGCRCAKPGRRNVLEATVRSRECSGLTDRGNVHCSIGTAWIGRLEQLHATPSAELVIPIEVAVPSLSHRSADPLHFSGLHRMKRVPNNRRANEAGCSSRGSSARLCLQILRSRAMVPSRAPPAQPSIVCSHFLVRRRLADELRERQQNKAPPNDNGLTVVRGLTASALASGARGREFESPVPSPAMPIGVKTLLPCTGMLLASLYE